MSVERGEAIQNLNQYLNFPNLAIHLALASFLMTASAQIFDELNDNSADYTSLNREQAIKYLYDRLVEYTDIPEGLNRDITNIKISDPGLNDNQCIAIIMANHLKLHKEASRGFITVNYEGLILQFHPQFAHRPDYAIVKDRFIEELSNIINWQQGQDDAPATLTIEMVEELIPSYWTRSSVSEEGASEPEDVTNTSKHTGLTMDQNSFPLHIRSKMRFVMGILIIYGDLLKDNFESPPQLADCLAKYLQNTREEQTVSS